jgi:hypothetical protein
MSKAARIVVSRPASTASSENSKTHDKTHELISIALFSGLGLLVTFVAILFGVQGVWF